MDSERQRARTAVVAARHMIIELMRATIDRVLASVIDADDDNDEDPDMFEFGLQLREQPSSGSGAQAPSDRRLVFRTQVAAHRHSQVERWVAIHHDNGLVQGEEATTLVDWTRVEEELCAVDALASAFFFYGACGVPFWSRLDDNEVEEAVRDADLDAPLLHPLVDLDVLRRHAERSQLAQALLDYATTTHDEVQCAPESGFFQDRVRDVLAAMKTTQLP